MSECGVPRTDEGRVGEIVDEFLAKVGRGEKLDVEAYAQQHPEAADVLRHALPALQAVAESMSCGRSSPVEEDTSISPKEVLGDFRISHELGRGGMGVVYEAEQLSMGRRVALKVLPFAGMVRGNSLQRFQNEVRAAAALSHPNIVSVYSVGEERGVHYYAMQLIAGQSLAEVIAQLSISRRSERLTADSISRVLSGEAAISVATEPTQEVRGLAADQATQATTPIAQGARQQRRLPGTTVSSSGPSRR